MNNNKYIDRITIQSPKEDRDFEEYNVFSPKDLDESLTFSNEWSSEKGIHFVIRNGKLVGITKNGYPVMAQNGVIYTESTEPFSFTIGSNTYNVGAGESRVELGLTTPPTIISGLANNAALRGLGLYLDSSKLTAIRLMFSNNANLEWIDISNLDLSKVTNCYGAFMGDSKLTDLRGQMNLVSITDMDSMFRSCSSLTTIDMSGWNTAACISMAGMFYNCSSLTNLDVSGWDFSSCTKLHSFMRGCTALQSLTLKSANSPVLAEINYLCCQTGVVSVDVNDFDVSAVTSMTQAFGSNPNLLEVIIPNWVAPNLQFPQELFAFDPVLKTVDISGLTMDKAERCTYMFLRCYALTSLKFPNMGQLKADTDNNKSISFDACPLDKASLESIFTYDRTANGLTNPLTVILSATSKALLTAEEIAAITAKGYTIA